MKKIYITIVCLFILVFGLSINDVKVSAQNLDNSTAISTYPTPIPAGATYDQVFPDEDLATCVASSKSKLPTDTLVQSDLTSITILDCTGKNIDSLDGIEYLQGLSKGTFNTNNITDLTPAASLTNATDLKFYMNNISDVTPLAGNTNLVTLNLYGNNITDISPLSSLVNMQNLDISFNNISDLTPLSSMTNMDKLYASDNNITDVTPLTGLTKMTKLNLSNNQITDISSLSTLTNLLDLKLSNNSISDLTAISSMTKLNYLYLGNNQISDLTPLANLNNILTMTLNNNLITDISPLANYGSTLSVQIDLSHNQISDITPLSNANLNGIDLSYNYIADISSLPTDGTLGAGYYADISNQTIDLGEVGKTITNPVISNGSLKTGTVTYTFQADETYDSSTGIIDLNSNFGTYTIYFEDQPVGSDPYSGTISFTRANTVPVLIQPGNTVILKGQSLNLLDGVSASDAEDGDISSLVIIDNPDGFVGDGTDAAGVYTITYSITDSDGNIVNETRIITVIDDSVTPSGPEAPTSSTTTSASITDSANIISNTGLTNLILFVLALSFITAIYYTIRYRLR